MNNVHTLISFDLSLADKAMNSYKHNQIFEQS